MPEVRTLTRSATKISAKPATSLVPDAAPQQIPGTLALPSWATQIAPLPEMPESGAKYNFVGQLQENTGKKATLAACGVQLGQYYLDSQGQITPLSPLRYWLIQASAFRTDMNASGQIIAATTDMNDKKLAEHVVALIVVDVDGVPMPAKADFRKTSWRAGSTGIEAVRFASDPDFPSRSDAHKVAAQCPVPFGRVLTTVHVQRQISRTSGKPYFASSGTFAPATVSEITSLMEAFGDDGFKQLLEEAKTGYESRVEMIRKLCK